MRMESPLNQRLRRSPPDVVYTPIDVTSESRLLNALASAIAHNVLYLRQTRGRRDEDRAIFYLNRLMCPAFRLPLGFGGYKPRKASDFLAWMTGDTEPQQLVLGTGRLE